MRPEDVWYANDVRARSARFALAPVAALYHAVVSARNTLYDRGVFRTRSSPIPVISVGNLTVGGTGKTPFTAYLVARLAEMGMRPAVVMRGYGADESLLHDWLNPGVRIYASPDRVAGIALAADSGANVAVLDDGFQHRRAGRALDIVLVSAEQWRESLPLLPAGPLREPLSALRRAGLVVVTCKSVTDACALAVVSHLKDIVPGVPVVRAEFLLHELVRAGGQQAGGQQMDGQHDETRSLAALSGADVLGIAGVADPASFFAQLRALGAQLTSRVFPDHHAYTADEVSGLAAAATHHKYAVTTGKDAVKLGPVWPAKGPRLWYVSQAVRISDGESVIARALRDAVSR